MSVSDSPTAPEPKRAAAIAAPGRSPRWSEIAASLAFSAAAVEMLVLYGIVHWQIMFRWTPQTPQPPEAVFTVLGHLGLLRLIFACFALVWAVWSFRGAPRWATWTALGFALAALCTNALTM